ncbi:MAG: penicillin-binding protein 2, partial [Spirochaetes bacterium]|nr:penicillin-binding protein 2 [Spirochaetota bacterium]
TAIPATFSDRELLLNTIKRLCHVLNISFDEVMLNIDSKNRWERITIKEDVDFDKIVILASHQNLFPNIEWDDKPVRVYNYDNYFCHAVGYVGSISKDEYTALRDRGYKYYQTIGKAGLEKQYDSELRGTDGFIRRIVDVRNRIEGEEIGLRPVAGNNLILTVDAEIQKTAHEAMADQNGAVIVIRPSTGEVLTLLSKPDFNPNNIISSDNNKIMQEIMQDKDRPFLNKAIQSRYPPASTFKLVTAIAALEEEKWNPNRAIYCGGSYVLKGYIDREFFDYHTHYTLDMYGAIAKSCCVYFYQVGYKIGPSIILKYASYMGLDKLSGIDIPGEVEGIIPSKEWKLKAFGQPWYDGDTLNLSIGQGFMTATVIGMANFICGIVNNGVVYKPHLIREIRSNDNLQIVKKFNPEKLREIPLSPVTVRTIKSGMRLCVTSGTAGRLSYLNFPIAAKTGTAQTRSKRKENYSQHAWVLSFAPCDDENTGNAIVIAVLVEYGITGAATAVPVAEKIYSKMKSLGYF